MSTDPRIEAAAEELECWDGWSRSLWPDRMNPDAAFSYRETAKAAIAAADKASSVTTMADAASAGLLARLSASGGRNIDLLKRVEAAEFRADATTTMAQKANRTIIGAMDRADAAEAKLRDITEILARLRCWDKDDTADAFRRIEELLGIEEGN